MDLNTRLAEIREMQGLDPLPNPSVIQGFEPGSSVVPAWNPPTSSRDIEDDDEDNGYPASPLIDVAVKKVVRPTPAPPTILPDIDLIVVDTEASYKGHTVKLNLAEKSAIARVILAASQRILDEHLRETEIIAPRALQDPPVKRKRGRPKKV